MLLFHPLYFELAFTIVQKQNYIGRIYAVYINQPTKKLFKVSEVTMIFKFVQITFSLSGQAIYGLLKQHL